MPELTGSFAPWALVGTVVTVFSTTIGIWFKHGPDWRRAGNEFEQIKINEAELIRSDYAKQIPDFRRRADPRERGVGTQRFVTVRSI